MTSFISNGEVVPSFVSEAKSDSWNRSYRRKLTVMKKNHGERLNLLKELKDAVVNLEESSYVRVSGFVHNCISHAQEDPERYRGSSWCHVGGSLQCVKLNEIRVILHVSGKFRDELSATYLDAGGNIDGNSSGKVVPLEGQEILQIYSHETRSTVIVGARHLYSCSLYILEDDDGKLSFEDYFVSKFHCPLASFDVSLKANLCCTIDNQKKIKVWDVLRSKAPPIERNGPQCVDGDDWSSVLFGIDDSSLLFLTDRMCLNTFDTVSGKIQGLFDLQHQKLQRQNLKNEQISYCFRSKLNNFNLYLATSDRLLLIDTRSPGHAVNVWLHSMSSPPLYSAVVPLGSYKKSEIVCMGNQHGSVYLTSSERSLVEVPTLTDSLYMCHRRGLVGDASAKLRISHDIVGLTCISGADSDHFKIVTQNALLDIFSRTVMTTGQLRDSYETAQYADDLKATGRRNLKHLHDCLNEDWQSPGFHRKLEHQKWNIPQHTILSYKDVLAAVLTDAWDLTDLPCKEKDTPKQQRVLDWLNTIDSEVGPGDTGDDRYKEEEEHLEIDLDVD